MEENDVQLQLKKRARRRLVGAIAFVCVVAVVLPMVMDHEPRQVVQDVEIRIPGQDEKPFAPKFAEAPVATVQKWQALLKQYLSGRATLRRAFVLIDARHGVKAVDEEILKLLDRSAVTFQAVLTKVDKINRTERAAVIEQVKGALGKHPAAYPEIVVTSSEKGEGIETLRALIATME